MTTFKKVILFSHRWLGFITGLVVVIVSITGCIFCFQDEIQDALYSYRKVEPQNKAYILPSVLKQKVTTRYPEVSPLYVYYYGPDRTAGVLATTKKDGLLAVYFNPYTGRQTYTQAYANNFFVVVEFIHLYLLLPPDIGKMVVGVSVLIFIFIMITGLVLWWPKRKTDRKRSFTIKWKGRWRRVNYDLHNVLGFYATSIAVILAITGISFSFEWVHKGIYTAGNLGRQYPQEHFYPKSDSLNKNKAATYAVVDKAFIYAQKKSPNAQMFLVNDDASASGTVGVSAYATSMHFANSDNYTFERYTGKLLKLQLHTKKSVGLKLNDSNYDIHVGQIAGLPGKIIAFLVSLVCASLPITGFIIWWGKRNKKPKVRKIMHVVKRKAKVLTHI